MCNVLGRKHNNSELLAWASEVNSSYAPWLNDAMTARSGSHDTCTMKYE